MKAAHEWTASDMLAAVSGGRITVRALIESCLARISARDDEVRAWLWLNADALGQADRLDALPADRRGRLHGLPIGVKDVFDTADMPTTHNSPLYQGFRPAADAAAVSLLRAEGAVLIGKTDTTEFAAAGRNAATGNPNDLTRTSGGSSAGSAAAVADFHVPLALATQTGGSTIRPAAFCGVYGFKPSAHRVSREGVKLYSISFDTVGWMARSVADIALLAVTFGLTERLRAPPSNDILTIGLTTGPHLSLLEPEALQALDVAEARLLAAGHRVTRHDLPPAFQTLDLWHRTVLQREGAQAFRALARTQAADLHDDFHRLVENRDNRSLAELNAAYHGIAGAQRSFDDIASRFDVILAPSAPGIAPLGRKPGNPIFNALWTALGVPCLNLPVGGLRDVSMPIGVTAIAMRFDDVALLEAGRRIAPLLAGVSSP
ncbi:Asp-tRNA(Asn)/Glu-tRNA(Gln) amidotransferase A subunit family amidase [Rhizobium sp. PP-F2F-G48]|uniref:amidase n=1 Tax=Rhizobium sp. PP-F2F-G48 TaxID=2135651 RepID=UPI00104FDFF9|nr:amidase [Rhizobium sp. PP-F2F-G48]TCM52654.1 Asp-tRNA(Asn)/Glu-tRNA(Gln) amidotransferase A subunit family amidase [Rhizobium sp. PP-F2F-G48]